MPAGVGVARPQLEPGGVAVLSAWSMSDHELLGFLFVVAILGFNSARQIKAINQRQPAMSGPQAIVAFITYICALAAHGLAGAPLIQSLLFPN